MNESEIETTLFLIGLSRRQLEVAVTLMESTSIKETAAKLHITPKTVKFHLTFIYKICKSKNRAALTTFFVKLIGKIPSRDDLPTLLKKNDTVKIQTKIIESSFGNVEDSSDLLPKGAFTNENIISKS